MVQSLVVLGHKLDHYVIICIMGGVMEHGKLMKLTNLHDNFFVGCCMHLVVHKYTVCVCVCVFGVQELHSKK